MKKGFTLIELLAVVLIMGILTAIALPQYRRSVERTRVAEAMQMLPSIFDARERLMTERNWNWKDYENNLPPVSFAKLDVELKGHQGPAGTMWKTENFIYHLTDRSNGSNVVPWVSGIIQRGVYKETKIYYKNGDFFCCPAGVGSEACSRLNIKDGDSC